MWQRSRTELCELGPSFVRWACANMAFNPCVIPVEPSLTRSKVHAQKRLAHEFLEDMRSPKQNTLVDQVVLTEGVQFMTKPNGPFHPSGPRPPGWPVSPFEPPKTPQLPPPDLPESSSGSEGEDEGSSIGYGPRPDWWPPYLDWPPKPSPPPEILYPPPIYTWPRLPVDHPYYLPPGYSWPNNLPPGHPGHNVPQPPKPIQA